jgi:transcriptional regulator with XRE-family HTH domain
MKKKHPTDLYVGKQIKALRAERDVSQTALADAVGVTFQQIQKYEKGSNRISASRLHEIAVALDKPIAWFFEGAPAVQVRKAKVGP